MKMGFKASVLASSFLVGVAFVVPAYAQQAPAAASAAAAEPEEAEETIVVTGTRLRRERLDNPNPTVQVGAEELEDRQIANVGDAIEDVPLLGFGSNARGTQTQNGDSAIFPDVLDLGTNRTLTLLNGRRLQPSLPATNFVPGNNTGAQVDLTTINPALISRVEIVAGTGGAIYGADAVGGVVNLITRTDYEGGLLTITGGMTELGDGAQARVTGLYGQDYFEGRGNAVISLDYFQQDAIFASAETAARYGGSLITNPFDGSVRNPATFSAASAADALRAGTALPTPFLPAASDGFSSTFLGPLNIASRLVSPNGVLLTRWAPVAGLAAGNQLVPSVPVSPFAANSAADPQGFAFFAPTALPAGVNALTVINTIAPGTNLTGLTAAQQTALAVQLLQRNRPTPIEWWRNNRSVNPLLLVGTFGTFPSINLASGLAANPAGGYFPTVTNTDPATALLFPRLAVPLQFNAAGDLVEFKLGSLTPENPGLWGSGFGSDGYDSTAEGHSQIQAGTERVSFGVLNSVEVTDNLRVRQEVLYNRLTYSQISAAPSNTPSGSAAAGSFAVPVYLDQNPFVSAQALSTVANLQTRGFVTPLTNGQRTMFIGRTLTDLFGGGLTSTADISTFRFMNAFEGQFRVFDRQFYWDVTGIYGKSETIATQQDVNDIAFALAIDPVRDSANNIVCRQQTLAAPESITVRNPGITSGLTTTSLIPTAAEVAACRPLNLLGNRPLSADDAARILTEQRTDSENVQTVASFSLSGELWQLPAGPLQLGIQAERREERSKYLVNDTLRFGRGRNATQGDNIGARQFVEYGYEANLPVFGPDFNFIGARKLEFCLRLALR
jgi:outer membrane receptor protein involved in Fe transport